MMQLDNEFVWLLWLVLITLSFVYAKAIYRYRIKSAEMQALIDKNITNKQELLRHQADSITNFVKNLLGEKFECTWIKLSQDAYITFYIHRKEHDPVEQGCIFQAFINNGLINPIEITEDIVRMIFRVEYFKPFTPFPKKDILQITLNE